MPEIIEITMPDAEQEGTESVIGCWFKKAGDAVSKNEPLLEISTDKVTIEVPSPADGVLFEILKVEQQPVSAGDVLGTIQPAEKVGRREAEPPAHSSHRLVPEAASVEPPRCLSPAVRRLVDQNGIDVNTIDGSGRGGRITHEDVLAHLQGVGSSHRTKSRPIETSECRMVPHTQMRRDIASHMVRSMLETAPHVTAVFEVDLSRVIAHRARHREAMATRGTPLTLTAYFVRALVLAIHEVPEVNSRWHDDALEIISDFNIGIATSLGKDGLIVPVLHQAQEMTLTGIADRLNDLTTRARSKKLSPRDVRGGTMTITNHGVSGSLIATPIINQPQSAILGIGKLQKRVIVVASDGQDALQIRPMAYVTLTVDHRVLDGFMANTFLTRFCSILENWSD